MAREGRCPVCGEQLAGVARFCSGCGAPADAAPLPVSTVDDERTHGIPVVRDRSKWPLVTGIVAVVVVAAALATSRMGETTSGAETTPTTASAPERTEPVATTTARPPITAAPAEQADVAQLPDDLADTTLILLTAGRSAVALDLGTGELTTFEIAGRSIRASDLLVATPSGILVSSRESESARLLDWSFVEQIELPFISVVEPTADGLWALRPAPLNQLLRVSPEGSPIEVRTFDGPIDLIGTVRGDALVTSPRSDGVRRVTLDGSTSLADEVTGFQGGTDWVLGFACAADLTCTRRLVDLRSGSTVETDLVGDDADEVGRSADGRRLVVQRTAAPGPMVIIDADELTVAPLPDVPERFEGPTTVDAELRYVFGPLAGVLIVSIDTGERWLVEVNEIVRRVIVAPDGWDAPTDEP